MAFFLKIKVFPTIAALCACASIQSALAAMEAGQTVDFDRLSSNNPDLAAWDRGVITGTTTSGGQTYYKIRNKAGTPYTVADDPRWIRHVDPSSTEPAPDGTHTGPYPSSKRTVSSTFSGRQQASMAPVRESQPGSYQNQTNAGGGAGSFPVGAKVEFDRVEGSKPEYSRWDIGVVIGHDQWGRVNIRAKNGIQYNIHDDPRWIVSAGTPHAGRPHNYLDQEAAKQNPKTQAAQNSAPIGGGPGGPLAGEWAVRNFGGTASEGFGMTLNFVGSRYELIHYSGQTESGHFTVSGATIRMVSEDGTPYGTFQYSIQGNKLTLTGPTTIVCERAHK